LHAAIKVFNAVKAPPTPTPILEFIAEASILLG
jgi:hypothetical protein